MTPCQHLNCQHPADAWVHIGGRWRQLCLDHVPGARARGGIVGPDADQPEPLPPRERAVELDERTSDRAEPVRPEHLAVRPTPTVRTRIERDQRDAADRRKVEATRRTLTPRPDAPAAECRCCPSPELFRRGLCRPCYQRAVKFGRLEEVAAPPAHPGPAPKVPRETCKAPGCTRPAAIRRRGLCRPCYTYHRARGDIDSVAPTSHDRKAMGRAMHEAHRRWREEHPDEYREAQARAGAAAALARWGWKAGEGAA